MGIEWVAGFLEGEGSFYVRKQKRKRGGVYHYAGICATSTDRDTLERVREITGVGFVRGPDLFDGRKPIYRWNVQTHRDAVDLMEKLEPLMCARRQARIQEILALFRVDSV